MNPTLKINLKNLRHNVDFLLKLCKESGITMAGVTKVFCADPQMVQVFIDAGVDFLADSRIENINGYPAKKIQKTMMLRMPAPRQAKGIVRDCDISLNSELDTLKALNYEAGKQKKQHGVIIMVDLGDLREGVYHSNIEEIFKLCKCVIKCDNLNLKGIGTNLTCYGSVLPTEKNMRTLVEIADTIEKKFGIELEIVSGGNSSALNMLKSGKIPEKINNLRLGESIVCGTETATGEHFEGLKKDIVTLEATIIELAKKPSMPEGDTNINAFGEKIEYIDKGEHFRAILSVGRQDVAIDGITPIDKGVEIIGASSDHLIVDVTQAGPLKIGDTLAFSLNYGAMLSAFTSKYVGRAYID